MVFRFTQLGLRYNFGVVVGYLPLTDFNVTKVMRAATRVGVAGWIIDPGVDSPSLENLSAFVIITTFLAWLTG